MGHAEELLGLLGILAAKGVLDPIGRQQLIEGVQIPAVDDLLVNRRAACLLFSTGMAPSLSRCRDNPTAAARTIAEVARWAYPRPSAVAVLVDLARSIE
jgi:hypothetical protein